MSIIERTPKLDLTQYTGSSVKAQFYANYNADMQKIDSGYATLDEAINGEEGLGAKVSALETSVTTIDEKADNAVSTANDAKTTTEGFDTRVTTLEGKVSDLETWAGGVDTTLTAYDGRLDAIEEVIETVSTANINDLIARMDALEQKVDANTQSIDTLNDNVISAVNRIIDLETGLGTTNANLNTLAGRVTLLEDCCSSVRETLTDHNTRINKNASDISALDARLTRDETNIAGNASDITILATQNNTQSQQIDDLYSKYNALDPTSPTNLYSRVQTLEDVVGDTPLQTTAQTVTGAINELFGHATDVDADEVDYDNTNSGLVATDVQGAIDEVNGKVEVDSARIGALETTVGGAGSGLVKDVSDLQSDVGSLESTVGDSNAGLVKDVTDLQTTVGDSSAGLVKDVGDLSTTVGDSTAGLVKDVADLQTTVGDATTGLVKDVADLDTRVTTLENKDKYVISQEQIIGEFAGKTLYRRTIKGVLANSTNADNILTYNFVTGVSATAYEQRISTADWNTGGHIYVTNIHGIARHQANSMIGTSDGQVPIPCLFNQSQLIGIWHASGTNNPSYQNCLNLRNYGYTDCEFVITVEYTKEDVIKP